MTPTTHLPFPQRNTPSPSPSRNAKIYILAITGINAVPLLLLSPMATQPVLTQSSMKRLEPKSETPSLTDY